MNTSIFNRQAGFTLIEATIVASILAAFALVVAPDFTSTRPYKVELAANEVAAAFRFIQTESLRTQSALGVRVNTSTNTVSVFRGNTSTTPVTPVFDVTHPVVRQPYTLNFDNKPETAGTAIQHNFQWSGDCNVSNHVYFDYYGTPRCGDPWNVLLLSGTLTVSTAGHTRTVSVAGTTGRVTVH